jgi:hypothetical protein
MSKKNLKLIKRWEMPYIEDLESTIKSREIRLRIYKFVISHSEENPKETLIAPDFDLTIE